MIDIEGTVTLNLKDWEEIQKENRVIRRYNSELRDFVKMVKTQDFESIHEQLIAAKFLLETPHSLNVNHNA